MRLTEIFSALNSASLCQGVEKSFLAVKCFFCSKQFFLNSLFVVLHQKSNKKAPRKLLALCGETIV